MFDLYFDPSWRGTIGPCGGFRGLCIASAPIGFASFSGLSFRLFGGLGGHVLLFVALASLCSRWLPCLIPNERVCLTIDESVRQDADSRQLRLALPLLVDRVLPLISSSIENTFSVSAIDFK